MPETPIYGLPFENPVGQQPGVTLHGGSPPSSPILAEAVEAELARIEAILDELEQSASGSVSIIPDVPEPVPNFFDTEYYRGTATVQLPSGLFTTTPRITVSAHSSVPGTVLEVTHNNQSATQFDIVVARTTQTQTAVHWHAVGARLPVASSPEFANGTAMAQLYRTSALALAAGTDTVIPFQAADLDRLNAWSPTVNPSRYTPDLAGWYLVSAMIGYDMTATATHFRRCAILKNGVTLTGGFKQEVPGQTTATQQVFSPTMLVSMNGTTDYIEIQGRSSGAVNTTTGSTAPRLTVVYAGPL